MQNIKDNIEKVIKLLSGVPEPERSLSFPVILSKVLSEQEFKHQETLGKRGKEETDDHKGLQGGIRRILSEGFFKEGRMLNEISEELKRQGYYYPLTSLPSSLLSFIKKRILTRYKGKDKKWFYVERV